MMHSSVLIRNIWLTNKMSLQFEGKEVPLEQLKLIYVFKIPGLAC